MQEEIKKDILQIDIAKIIGSKNPKLLKILPGFLLNYIKRILHQDELNYVLRTNSDKYSFEFVDAVMSYFNITYKIVGEENIPRTGHYIYAANHPIGGLEGMALIQMVGKYFKDVRFIVNDLLLNLENYHPILVPVNKHGSHTKDYAQRIEESFTSGSQVMYFPAGLVSRKINGKVVDLEWKKSFITKAVQHKRDVIPVFIDGKNSNFFYNLSNFRKAIGIKANIEMFYLSNEMFKQKNKTLTLHVGKPIPYTTFDKSKSQPEWAAYVKDIVYQMQ